MNFKKNSAITLVVLVITVIVMLIIFGITISSGTDLLRNTQKNRLKTNLYIIHAEAENFLEDFLFDKTSNCLLVKAGNYENWTKCIYKKYVLVCMQ